MQSRSTPSLHGKYGQGKPIHMVPIQATIRQIGKRLLRCLIAACSINYSTLLPRTSKGHTTMQAENSLQSPFTAWEGQRKDEHGVIDHLPASYLQTWKDQQEKAATEDNTVYIDDTSGRIAVRRDLSN